MKAIFFFFIFCIALVGCASDTVNKSTKDNATSKSVIKEAATPLIEQFFKELSAGAHEQAIINLLATNENINLQDSAVLDLKTKIAFIATHTGNFVDHKLLKERDVEGAIAFYSYLVRYEKKYFRILFQFYNNGKSTKIYKFFYDETLDLEAEESLKLYSY